MITSCSFDQADPGLAGVPRDAIVRTVLGDIDPSDISGTTLFHEHLSIRMSPDRPSATDDVDNIVREIQIAASEGVGCIVDGGHPDLGRDLDAVMRVANETDVHVVACTGYYMERFHQAAVATSSEDEIAEGLIADAARYRLGAYGEIGQSSNASEPWVRRTSRRASRSSRTTPTAPATTSRPIRASGSWTFSSRWV
jgi:phosphotriesterase-related protein